jgi:hypothetical protein
LRARLAGTLLPAATAGEVSMAEQPLTIGIEEEFQIIDAGGELKAHIDTLLAAAQSKRGPLLPAPPACPVDLQPVLAEPAHRAQVIP